MKNGSTILVVEDEKNVSDLLQMYLRKEGFQVLIAPARHFVPVALLLLLHGPIKLHLLVVPGSERFADGSLQLLHDGGDVGDFAFGAFVQFTLQILRALGHAGFEGLRQRHFDLGPEFLEPVFDKAGRTFVGSRGGGRLRLANTKATEAALPENAAGEDELLVDALVVAAEDEQPAVNQDSGRLQGCVRHHAGGKAVELLGESVRPDFGAEQAKTHLDQPMVQVTEHDIVAACGKRVIEDDGANLVGVGMGQTFGA